VQTARPEKLKTTKAAKRSNAKAAKGSTTQAKRKKKSKGKSFDDLLLEYWNNNLARDERIDNRPKLPWLGLTSVRGVTSGGLPGHGKR